MVTLSYSQPQDFSHFEFIRFYLNGNGNKLRVMLATVQDYDYHGFNIDRTPSEWQEYTIPYRKKFALVSWSLDWNSMFPIEICQNLASAGYVPHIIWDPYYANKEKQIEPDDILSGEWDDYIISWVEACKNWGNPLFIT